MLRPLGLASLIVAVLHAASVANNEHGDSAQSALTAPTPTRAQLPEANAVSSTGAQFRNTTDGMATAVAAGLYERQWPADFGQENKSNGWLYEGLYHSPRGSIGRMIEVGAGYEVVRSVIPENVPIWLAGAALAYLLIGLTIDRLRTTLSSTVANETNAAAKPAKPEVSAGKPEGGGGPGKPEGGGGPGKPEGGGGPPPPEPGELRPFKEKAVFISLAVSVSFLGELFYGLPVSFLPGEAAVRQIPPNLYGFIISSFALGVLPTAVVAPSVTKYFEPYTILNVTLTLQCFCAFMQAVAAQFISAAPFVTIMVISRVVMGASMAFNETIRGAIVTSMVSKQKAGYVQGVSWAIRNIGTFIAPAIGGVIYQSGGQSLVYIVAGSLLFFFNMCQTTFIFFTPDPPQRNYKQSSLLEMISYPIVWAALIPSFFNGFIAYSLEPLYETVLSQPPYTLSVSVIGLFASILAVGWSFGFFFIGTWAVILLGDLVSLSFGMVLRVVALIFLGPFWGMPASSALFAVMAFLTGMGDTVGGPSRTMLAFTVLEAKGMPKGKIGGSLSAVLLFLQYSGALLGPIFGTLLDEAIGFQGVTLFLAIALATTYVPCAMYLIPYRTRGTCEKKKE